MYRKASISKAENRRTEEKNQKIKERNNRRDARLTKENKLWMTEIICYLREKSLEEGRLEDIRQDITDMFLEAQERGETAEKVMGGDYKSFCEQVVESLGEHPEITREKRNFGLFIAWLPVLGLFSSGLWALFAWHRGRTWDLEQMAVTLVPLVVETTAAFLVKLGTRNFIPIPMDYWIRGKRKYFTLLCGLLFLTGEILFYIAGR